MLATQAQAGKITLPHEVGHSMGLHHVFRVSAANPGGVGICPANPSTALNGDLVVDTEPQEQSNFNCPSGINTCTGAAWANGQRNFMDYSNCQDRFTPGQRTRVNQIMNLNRVSLYTTSLGGTPVSSGQLGGSPPATTCGTITHSNPTSTSNLGPRNVTLNDMNVSTSGYSGDGFRVYLNKSCTQRPTALLLGTTYNLSVTCGGTNENIRIWIDFNNDGVFNNTNELIGSVNGATSYAPSTGWTTPTSSTGIAMCVPVRMRVMTDATSNGTMNSCGPLTQGQIEDYSVVFRPATAIVSVSIAANPSGATCVGTPVTFTATPNGTVSSSSYKWFVNGVYTGFTGNPYTASTFANGDVVRAQLFYSTTGGCYPDSAFSNSITVLRTTSGAAGVSIALTAGNNPGCPGQTYTFTANPVNGGTSPNYDWKINGTTMQSGTSNTFTTAAIVNGNSVTVVMTSNAACISPISATSNAIVISQANVVPSVTIAVTSGSNPGCPGVPLTFTATPTNGGTAPTYQWKINGANQASSGPTFTTSSLNNGDVVSVVMTSNLACAVPITATSNNITFTVAPVIPAITNTLTAGSNPGCPGQSLTFTGNPTNGGSNPIFQWKRNGINITGATNGTYTTTTLVAGDVITVTLTSNDPCATTAPVTSNGITIIFNTVSASVSIALSGGSTNPTCAGKIINFTATPTNGGGTPVYNWKKNGTPVGVTTVTFSSAAIANGDVITVDMTSSNPCAVPITSTSNPIAMTVIPVDTPKVTITITKGSNPGCKDSLIEFTATTTPSSLVPTYTWQLNAVTVASGPVYSSVSLITNDVIMASIALSGPGCRSTDNTSSAPITMIRNATPPPPLVSLIGNMLVANYPNVQWYGPNGLIPGATSQSYHPGEPGYYYCVAMNVGCNSGPSNRLLISLMDIATYSLDGVSIYPNPSNGQVVIDWGSRTATVKIDIFNALSQHLKHDDATNVSRKVVDLTGLANGNYFIVIRDEEGKAATSIITIKN